MSLKIVHVSVIGAVEEGIMDKECTTAQQVQEQFHKATSSSQSEGDLTTDPEHATLIQKQ